MRDKQVRSGNKRAKSARGVGLFATFALLAAACTSSSGTGATSEVPVVETTLAGAVVGGETEPTETTADDADESDDESAENSIQSQPSRPALVAAPADGLADNAPTMFLNRTLAPTEDRETWVIVGSLQTGLNNRATVWMPTGTDLNETTPIDVGPPGINSNLLGVAEAGDALVAVGDSGVSVSLAPFVTRNVGGAGWTEVDAVGFGDEVSGLFDIFELDGALLAVASVDLDDGENSIATFVSNDQGDSWEKGSFDDFGFPTEISIWGAAVLNDTIVMSGGYFDPTEQRRTSVVWTSTDGALTFTAIPDGSPFVADEDVWTNRMVVHNDQFVTVGGVEKNEEFSPAVWTSTDGLSWVVAQPNFPVTDDGRAAPTGIGAWYLSSNGDTLVAGSWSPWVVEIWTSADAASWQLTSGLRDVEANESIPISDLGIGPDGTIVAFELSDEPMVRTDQWRRVESSDTFPVSTETPDIREVVWKGGRFVAAAHVLEGQDGSPVPRFWWSDDGVSWTLATIADPLSSEITEITVTDSGFVAAGRVGSDESEFNHPTRLWFSENGESWANTGQLGNPEVANSWMNDMAGFGDQVVVTGSRQAIEDDFFLRPMVAFATAEGDELDESVILQSNDRALGAVACSGPERAVVFMHRIDVGNKIEARAYDAAGEVTDATATDGSFDGASAQVVLDCVWTGTDFVAVGAVSNGTDDDGIMWRSPDGVSWTKAAMPSSSGGLAFQTWADVVPFGDGLIVIGEDDRLHAGAVLWVQQGADWIVVEDPIAEARPGDVTILDMVVGDDRVVAVGDFGGVEQIWSSSIPDFLVAVDQAAS